MTINQQPDALSLSLNIKDFKIATTTSVPFVLKKGTTELVAQNYEPGQDGFVTISVRDMVHAQLSFALPPNTSPYEQPNIAADFTAVVDGTEVTFRVLRAGVDKLADTAANFLTANWLTWQPQTKAVTYSSPEYLSYYSVATSVAKLKAYFTNEAGEVTSEQTITLHNLTAGKAYTLTTQYAAVSALLGNALPAFYDVWVEDGSGTRLTYIQRYYAGNMQSEQEDWVLFENSLGGIDCFRAYGATNFTGEHTHNLAEIDEVSQEYRVDTERKYDKNTGYLDKEQRRWLLDFFPSLTKYIYTAQALRSIVVTESNVTYTDKELPSNFSFTYKYADATALLNIARTATPTEVLTISVPDLGNFTVPPRLVEVARLPLTEGALFPVQSPYSEEWATTTAGAIFNFVKNLLGSSYEGGGGIGHTHGNLEVLQALSYAAGYLRYDGAKLKAGYADDIPEVINKIITFAQGLKTLSPIEVGEVIDSMLAGRGTLITPDKIQTPRLEVRGQAVFMEMIINRLSAMEGDTSFSESGTIESVTQVAELTYKLQMRRRWETDFTSFDVGDVVYGIVNDLFNGSYYKVWFLVQARDLGSNELIVVQYTDNMVPGGVNYPPTDGMVVARRGNTTNEDRQSCWYISTTEGAIMYLTGVTKPILEESNYSLILGRPKQLELFNGLPLNYNNPYLYARGAIIQDLFRIDYQGNPSYEDIDCGLWDSNRQYINGYNDVSKRYVREGVWHESCYWRCTAAQSTIGVPPRFNNTEWTCLVGDKNYTIEILNPDKLVRVTAVAATLSVVVRHGTMDITSDVVLWEWTRSSGLPAEDNLWAIERKASESVLAITNADMASNWLDKRKVSFRVQATIIPGVAPLTAEYSIN